MMFGFACTETDDLYAAADPPAPPRRAPRRARKGGKLSWPRPDAKSQVTVEYNADGTPNRIHTVVLSTQHTRDVMVCREKVDYFTDDARQSVIEQLLLPVLRREREDLIKGNRHAKPGEKPLRERHRVPHQPDRLLPDRRPAR